MWYFQSKKDDSEVINKVTKLAETYATRSFDEYYHKTRREVLKWNRKRILCIRNMKLSLRRKHQKRLVKRVNKPL